MKLLDLFCGAGGAAKGYANCGFEILGIDIEQQRNYPFEFIQADAIEYLKATDLSSFSAIHASPPCQRWSTASGKSDRSSYPDFIRPLRPILEDTGLPYIIENVEYAPLRNPLKLCGVIFPNLRVIRHRLFECNFFVEQPKLECGNHPFLYKHKNGTQNPYTGYVTIAGGGDAPLKAAQDAIGIDWMPMKDLSQAIPPTYTEYIGQYLIRHLLMPEFSYS